MRIAMNTEFDMRVEIWLDDMGIPLKGNGSDRKTGTGVIFLEDICEQLQRIFHPAWGETIPFGDPVQAVRNGGRPLAFMAVDRVLGDITC